MMIQLPHKYFQRQLSAKPELISFSFNGRTTQRKPAQVSVINGKITTSILGS